MISDATAGEPCLLSQYDRDICLVLVHEESIARARLSEKALNKQLSALDGTEGYRIAVGRPIEVGEPATEVTDRVLLDVCVAVQVDLRRAREVR